MKDVIFYLSISFILASCDNGTTFNTSEEAGIIDAKFERITFSENEYDRDMRLSKWRETTPNHRYYLWVDKLTQVLTQPLSEQQRLLIGQLSAKLSPALFDYNNPQFPLMLKSLEDEYLSKVEKYFSFDEQVMIFASLQDFNPLRLLERATRKNPKDSTGYMEVESRGDCNCRWSC